MTFMFEFEICAFNFLMRVNPLQIVSPAVPLFDMDAVASIAPRPLRPVRTILFRNFCVEVSVLIF